MEYAERDDKILELICRVVLWFTVYFIACGFGDGFTFAEGVIVWMITGCEYDTTVILNNQRLRELRGE